MNSAAEDSLGGKCPLSLVDNSVGVKDSGLAYEPQRVDTYVIRL